MEKFALLHHCISLGFLMQDYYILSCDFAICHIWNNLSRTGLMYNAKNPGSVIACV